MNPLLLGGSPAATGLQRQAWVFPGRCRSSARLQQRAARRGVAAAAPSAVTGDQQQQAAGPLAHGLALRQGPRSEMEDVVTAREAPYGFLYAAVYDGHNGDSAAKWLVKNMYAVFETLLDEQQGALVCDLPGDDPSAVFCPMPLQHTLESSFRHADQKLLQWLREHEHNSGCTATAALVRRDVVVVANVGDSRAVLCRGGQAVDLTVEHRVYGRGPAVRPETQRIQEAGGWVDDGRVCGVLAVSRAFGDWEFKGEGLPHLLARGVSTGLWTQQFADTKRFVADPVLVDPDVSEVALGAEDEFLVMATDGLWDVISSQDVVTLARNNLKKGLSPQEVANKLAEVALKRYTSDNVGVVVVALKDLAAGGTQQGRGGSTASSGKKKGLFGLW